MDIKVFVWEGYLEDEFSMKIIDLIKSSSLHYTLLPIKKEADMDTISTMVGEKVRKLPQIVINGERIGGYYDLVEHLINKEVINYTGEPTWKKKYG